jgi:hypothetical protein
VVGRDGGHVRACFSNRHSAFDIRHFRPHQLPDAAAISRPLRISLASGTTHPSL